jgi:hypothetical protein
MRNPDEKPLAVIEETTSSETVTLPKPTVKQSKEDSKSPSQDALPVQKTPKEAKNSKSPSQDALPIQKAPKEAKKVAADSKSTVEHIKVEDKEISGLEKPQKDTPAKDNEVDAAKLKEIKREEEIAKAKIAMERKKKLAEKAEARAAMKTKKAAEEKLKEIINFYNLIIIAFLFFCLL